jgi:hypothetical protein
MTGNDEVEIGDADAVKWAPIIKVSGAVVN